MTTIKLLALAGLMSATAATAVTVTSSPGAPDPGPSAGQSLVVTFDLANTVGYTFSTGLHTSAISISKAAEPSGDTTKFGYVSSQFALKSTTLSTPNLKSISFYWGSIDGFNNVDVLGASGVVIKTINGTLISPANGNQSAPVTNRRVDIVAGPGEVITGLTLRSSGVAFEFDNFAAAAVPDAATWMLFVGGFGLVGLSARRRRSTSVIV